MKSKRTKHLTTAAMVAALYVVLTGISALLNLDKGVIQLRLSEALTVLPVISPASIPGLYVGCMLSSMLYGGIPIDVIFGSLATLIGAVGTYYIGKKSHLLATLPPVIANTIAVPLILKYAYMADGTVPFFAVTVFIGEFLCCCVLGTLLLRSIPKSLSDMLK